jgi:hypothetical protein
MRALHWPSQGHEDDATSDVEERDQGGDFKMAKKSRGGRMTAAKKRAAKRSGGRGRVKNRAAGRNIMKT